MELPWTISCQLSSTMALKWGCYVQKLRKLKYFIPWNSVLEHLTRIVVWLDPVLARCSTLILGNFAVHSWLIRTLSNLFHILCLLSRALHHVNLGPEKPASTISHSSILLMKSQLFCILWGFPPFFSSAFIITLKSPDKHQGPLIIWLQIYKLSHRGLLKSSLFLAYTKVIQKDSELFLCLSSIVTCWESMEISEASNKEVQKIQILPFISVQQLSILIHLLCRLMQSLSIKGSKIAIIWSLCILVRNLSLSKAPLDFTPLIFHVIVSIMGHIWCWGTAFGCL